MVIISTGSCLTAGIKLLNRVGMDIVFIKQLEIETVIGIYDWERKIRQVISLDLDMATDIKKAANTDNIEDTLNYKAVAKRLIAFVGESEYELVETLAEKICAIVMTEFNVPWVRLTLHKPGAVSGSQSVGVMIERGVRG
jgi:dihydroneopterin aldolase